MYVPELRCGFANRFRSICGLIVLSLLNNADFCVKYDAFFEVMNESLSILKCNSNYNLQRWRHENISFWTHHCDPPCILNQSLEISTFSDYTSALLNRPFNYDYFKLNYYNASIYQISKSLNTYLFQPKQYLISKAENILRQLNGVKIGIQLRFGGRTASTHEGHIVLNIDKMEPVIMKIKQSLNTILTRYTIFLSSDTPSAKQYLKPLSERIITTTGYALVTVWSQTFSFCRGHLLIYMFCHTVMCCLLQKEAALEKWHINYQI